MRRTIVIILALAVALPAAAAADPVVVANGAVPARGVQTMHLEEMWRAGGADDEENFFGLVTWAEAGPDGLVYVLDTQLCQVNVYDDTGALVRTLFRQGEGPGEVNRPRDLVIMPDGTIGAVQEFPGSIVRVTPDGIPAETIRPHDGDATAGGFIGMTAAEHRGGTFMVAGVKIRPGERDGTQVRTMYLATVGDDGRLGARFLESTVAWDFTDFTYDEAASLPSFFWANAVGPDGRVYAAPDRGAYRIDVYAPDGTLERVITREHEPWRRTAQDKVWLTALLEGAFRNLPFPYDLKLCETESAIHWLNRGVQVAADGSLWILPSRGTREQPAGVVATFDVFTPQGEFDRQVRVACAGDSAKDGIFLLDDERVLLIRGYVDAVAAQFGGGGVETAGEEAAPMEIVCYRRLDQVAAAP
ncbi:MAG: hypothetical protein R6X35_02200 [Candidatus Krumholzibacteriia bacterium]